MNILPAILFAAVAVSGVVYDDANRNGRRACGERGLLGVRTRRG